MLCSCTATQLGVMDTCFVLCPSLTCALLAAAIDCCLLAASHWMMLVPLTWQKSEISVIGLSPLCSHSHQEVAAFVQSTHCLWDDLGDLS